MWRAQSAVTITSAARRRQSAKAAATSVGAGVRVSRPVSRKPLAVSSSPMNAAAPMSARPVEDENRDDQAVDRDAFGESDDDQHAAEQVGLLRHRADRRGADRGDGDAR